MSFIQGLTRSQYHLYFDVERSIHYHDERHGFFKLMHQVTQIFTVLMAAAVIFEVGISGKPELWLKGLSFFTAVLIVIDLGVGFSAKANNYQNFKKRWIDVKQRMMASHADPSAWVQFTQDRLAIEAEEPAIYRALDLACYNHVHLSHDGDPALIKYIPWYCRWTKHFFRWSSINEMVARIELKQQAKSSKVR